VHEDVRNIKQILDKTRRSATLRSSDTVVQQMPLKPGVFHGRNDIIEEITQLLMKEETSHVCILGPGGMGKTSISLGVVEQPLIQARFLPENCVWVPCIEATSANLLLEILYIQLQVPGNKEVTIEKIISVLNTSTQPRLILLDNFETPYNVPGGTQKQVEDILRRLTMLSHVAILVTMRGRYPPFDEAIKWQSKNIQPTDEAACLRIYHSIYPDSENDHDLGRLLSVLGHMPFAVTLMARLAKEGRSTAEELLSAWSEYGPDILPDHYEQNMNRSISLSVNSYLMRQNPQALLLLKVLSCLPAGTTKVTLRWWVPALHVAMVPSAIATLSKAGLLVENERQDSDSPILFVLPVVQSFMQQHGRIEELIQHNIQSSCCQYVLDHACREYDPAFPIKSKSLAAEDTNIHAILYGSPMMQHSFMLSDRGIEALVAFNWYRCITKPNLEIAKHAVSTAKGFGIKRYIASALWCLGMTYGLLGEYYAAYDHVQEAYQLLKDLLPGDRELQRLCCRCGIDLVDMARVTFEDGDKAISLARDIEKQCATISDDLVHARSLIVLGLVLQNYGHRQEALRHLERAKLKSMRSTYNLTDICHAIAFVRYHENRLPEALDAVKEAWEHAEFSNSLVAQAQISLDFGMILFSANRDTEAWKVIEISLVKNSHLGNRYNSANALEYMGYGYLRRGDYLNAYGAYEAAVENYLGTVVEEPDGTACKDNMAKIKDKQANPDLDVGFKRPRLDNDWPSLFYPAVKTFPNDTTSFH
jgi:tetratricopeptide (TPR) repeat protein